MITLDYLAGFMDGEGSFTVSREREVFRFRITLCSSDYNVIKEIQDNFGGRLSERKHQNGDGHLGKKTIWALVWHASESIALARLLKDKLVVKKKQAEEFCNVTHSYSGGRIDDTERSIRMNVFNTIRQLNQVREVIS